MRSLQHVLWRGAMALGLLLGSSAGIWALPRVSTVGCVANGQRNFPQPSHVAELRVPATVIDTGPIRC